MGYNEYCKFCVFFDLRRKWCSKHSTAMRDFDTCREFTREE
jgi:hypothetical protein